MAQLRKYLCAALIGAFTATTFACGDEGGPTPPPAAATIAAVSGDGQADTIGAALNEPLTVRVLSEDERGVPEIPVEFAIVQGDVVLSDGVASTDLDGRASVTVTLGESAGNIQVEARVSGVPGTARFELTSLPGNLHLLLPVSGQNQIRFPGTEALELLTVGLVDRAGNEIAQIGVPVSWQVIAGGGSISPESGATNALGEVSARWTLGAAEGENIAQATAGNILAATFVSQAAVAGPIVFASSRGTGGLFVMNADGSDVIQLTTPEMGLREPWVPAWSPDGTRIAFSEFPSGGRAEIWAINVDGSGLERLIASPEGDDILHLEPAWSPDGSKIAFGSTMEGRADIFLMNPDGTGLTNLTNSTDVLDQCPAWSPDGSRIVFMSSRAGNLDLWVMNADGSDPVQLTNVSDGAFSPDWSPDGSSIVFTRGGDIWMINIDGTGLTRLAVAALGYDATWSPDGTQILYRSFGGIGGAPDLFLLDVATGAEINLTNHPATDDTPGWRR